MRTKGLLLFAILAGSAGAAAAAPQLTSSPSPSLSPSPSPSVALSGGLSSILGLAPDTAAKPSTDLPDLTLDKSGGITLTLENSVAMAIQGATLVLKGENQTRVTGAALLQGYGQFLPNLVGQGNYSYQTGNQYLTTGQPEYVNGSNSGAAYSVTADLNLFNGLSDYSSLQAALLRRDASNLSLHRAKQIIALDITQSFLQVVLDNQLVDIARKNLQESQAREELLSAQTRLGVRNLSDLFRQQAQTSQAESLLYSSEDKTRTDQLTFLRKLRADVAKSYHFVEPAIPEHGHDEHVNDEAQLLDVALSHRDDLKAVDDQAEAANWDIKTSWGGYLPKLDLAGGLTSASRFLYSQNVNGETVVPPTQNTLGYQLGNQVEYSAGIYLTWTLFDRFLMHENVTNARAAADNADIDAQDFRNQVESDVRQAYGDYKTALSQLKSSKKGLEAAQKAYEVIEGRYEVGSANFIDLITAQADLLQAESARAQALIAYVLQSKTLRFATGEDQE